MKYFSTTLALITAVIVTASIPLFARSDQVSDAGNKNIVTENNLSILQSEKESSLPTVFFNLKLINCDQETGALINDGIRKELHGIRYLNLISLDEMTRSLDQKDIAACSDKNCTIKLAKKLKAKRVIIGSVTKEIRATKEEMGKEGEFKYIYEVKKQEFYVIRIELIDVPEKETLSHFEEKSIKTNIRKSIDSIIQKMQSFYKPPAPKAPPKLTPWLSLSGSCMAPFGSFSKITDAAGGITLDFGLKHMGVPNTYCKISGSYYFLSHKMGNVTEFQSGQVSAMGGYSFPLPMGFSITPSIGAGCQIHYIKDYDKADKLLGRPVKNTYIDPLVVIKLEGAYEIYKGLNVILTPGYTLFFEKGQLGQYMNIDLGMKYEIEIPQRNDESVK